MSIPPRRVAVLGAGPVGLEAALYARVLGHSVQIYEKEQPGAHLLRFAHVRWFTPWKMICSPLAAQQLQEHCPDWALPWNTAPTARQIVDLLLEPLACCPVLAPCLRTGVQVVRLGRNGVLKTDLPPGVTRAGQPFRLLLQDENGRQWCEEADVVLDCTGTFGRPNPLGAGGIPAPGESDCAAFIHRDLPDVLHTHRRKFAGRRVLVVGSGYSAATTVVALAELARQAPQTRIWWATRRMPPPGKGPLRRFRPDPLPLRDALARQANLLAQSGDPVVFLPGMHVEQLRRTASGMEVSLGGNRQQTLEVDVIVSNTGYRGDWSLAEELHLHQCYATQGPIRLAAALLKETSQDCLQQPETETDVLKTPEPDFFVLGAKSYGRNSQFLLQQGWQQVRDAFRLLHDDPQLDLYRHCAVSGTGTPWHE